MKKIIFTDVDNPEGALEKPKPASAYIPDWYKNAKPFLQKNWEPQLEGGPNATIKRCMPLWDMMTAGYILETPYDLYVRQTPDGPFWQWGDMKSMAFQPKEQLQNHPWFEGQPFGSRLIHPWSVTTPKGWSILVMQPAHREELPLQVIPGIVDTDEFSLPFNVFVRLTDPTYEGMIPKGTPFIQIIPFKREDWESSLGGEKEKKKIDLDNRKMSFVFFDKYKKFWWKRKSYK